MSGTSTPSVNYTITIKNDSAAAQEYVLFMKAPLPTIGDTPAFSSNVYQKTSFVQNRGRTAHIIVPSTYYAVTGTTSSIVDLQGAGSVSTIDWASISLGTATTPGTTLLMVVDHGDPSHPSLSTPASDHPPTADPGAFMIKTGTDFSIDNQSKSSHVNCPIYKRQLIFDTSSRADIFAGMGVQNGPSVVPVSICPALPSRSYEMFPKPRYYVAAASGYAAGQSVDEKVLGSVAMIDFSILGSTSALVTHTAEGTYTVTPNNVS